MTDIRVLPAQAERVETGPVQFGDDWPGVFIRGDNAGYYALVLKEVLQKGGVNWIQHPIIESLQDLLASAVVEPVRKFVTLTDGIALEDIQRVCEILKIDVD